MLNQLREQYNKSMSRRQNLIPPLTNNERNIFLKISSELKLSPNNIPGFFFINLPYTYLLKTASYVWHLWIYQRFIHNQASKQSTSFPELSVDEIYDDMCILVEKNYFLMNENTNKNELKSLILDCISEYKKMGIIIDKSNGMKEIIYDQIPLLDMKDNIFVELFYNFILPELNFHFDFTDDTVPPVVKRAIYIFQNRWINSYTGYCIQDQFKGMETQGNIMNSDLIIYADQKLLNTALTYLSDEQKNSIATYLKNDSSISTSEICELLIEKFHLNSEKDSNGLYHIYKYVDEYIFSSLWLWN